MKLYIEIEVSKEKEFNDQCACLGGAIAGSGAGNVE